MKCVANVGKARGHDWALVSASPHIEHTSVERNMVRDSALEALWACPCGEFKWTSYAEREQMLQGVPIAAKSDQAKEQERDAISGGGDS